MSHISKVFLFLTSISSTVWAILCGTPQAIHDFEMKKTSAPPSLPFFLGTEHFKIWYDTTGENKVWGGDNDRDSILDYVESTAVYLENIWSYLVDSLGYSPPLPDSIKLHNPEDYGGDTRTDIYIANATGGIYGMTMIRAVDTIGGIPVATSYSIIENDFSEFSQYSQDPFPALTVTCAHEFFHNIQFAYRFSSSSEMVWWMEATAVACEEICFDNVNDYIQYIRLFQDNCTDTTIFHCSHYYGGSLLPLFLMEYHSQGVRDFSIIRNIWEKMRTIASPQYAIDEVLRTLFATDFYNDFFQFCRWRLRVNKFWAPGYFKEGSQYPIPDMAEIPFAQETTIIDTLPRLSCNFFIVPHIFTGNGIWGNFMSDIASNVSFFVEGIGNDPSGMSDTSISITHNGEVGIPGLWRFKNVAVGAVMLSCINPSHILAELAFSDSLLITPPDNIIFGTPFPNPSSEFIYFPITSPDITEAILSIYNSAGELLHQSKIDVGQGEQNIFWNCKTNQNKKISPGIYLYVILAKNPYGKWQETRGKILILTE